MFGTLLKSFVRPTSQLNVKGLSCSRLQNYRNITSTHLLNQSKGDEGNGEQTDLRSKDEVSVEDSDDSNLKSTGWNQFATKKYSRYAESTARVIYDFREEQQRLEEGLEIEEFKREAQEDVILERGQEGVFDVAELVDLLMEENARDIVVIKVPDDMKYVDYMVIATGKSERHISALSQLVRKVYKKKKDKTDKFVVVEGKNTGWNALDMGNIALHIMNKELRESYDLETLWTVGAQYDEQSQQEQLDPLDMFLLDNLAMQKYSHGHSVSSSIGSEAIQNTEQRLKP